VSSDISTSARERLQRRPRTAARQSNRALAILLIGPLTILGALVWAVAQPYRIVFLHPDGKGLYDFLFQPPLLAALVGVVFMLVIAPGLVEDLERDSDDPAR
jgi:hypothetical protein